MPIEGPLHELGLQDVFQLLDLSRKTGILRVISRMREDEGRVYFDGGRIVQASLRSKPAPAVERGELSEREFERRVRAQIETVVFDLMAWREGFFSFEERDLADVPPASRAKIASESLLMEAARRIDEWSRIADKIPHMHVVPLLAEVEEGHESQLDLLPHEWEVLSLIDGERDLGAIAAMHSGGEFEIAKVVYGLLTTGVVEIKSLQRPSISVAANGSATASQLPISEETAENPEIMTALNHGFAAARAGDLATARTSWGRFLELAPTHPAAARVRAALEAAATLQVAIETHDNA